MISTKILQRFKGYQQKDPVWSHQITSDYYDLHEMRWQIHICWSIVGMLKTYDTLNHVILLDKRSCSGISGIQRSASILASFDNQNLEMAQSTTGVPQESILGHLLFSNIHVYELFCKDN